MDVIVCAVPRLIILAVNNKRAYFWGEMIVCAVPRLIIFAVNNKRAYF